MKHLIVGRGQVGSALLEVLSGRHAGVIVDDTVMAIDAGDRLSDKYDVLHICFPYQTGFAEAVREYQRRYLEPQGLTIIHSTVVLGTSKELGAVHSPIRGVHPNLAKGIQTFVKFFGGPRAEEAAQIFMKLGIPAALTPDSRNTEAMKLWDTTQYGWSIIIEKAIHEYCEKMNLDFDTVYTFANVTYNTGYETLGQPSVRRPVLRHMPGPIGGHCVMPNAALLNDEIANILLIKGAE